MAYGPSTLCVLLVGYLLYTNTVERWGWAFSVIVFLVVAGVVVAFVVGRSAGRQAGYDQALLDARKRAGAIADPQEIEDFLANEEQKELRESGIEQLENFLRGEAHRSARGVRKTDLRREEDKRRFEARNRDMDA